MKTILFASFLLCGLSGYAQKRYIPDLINDSKKIPVVVDFPYGLFNQTQSGAYLFNGDLGVPSEKRLMDVDQHFFQDEPVEIAKRVVVALNKQFSTDKFYYLNLETIKEGKSYSWNEHDIRLFVSCLMTIHYEFSNTVSAKYSVAKRSSITFFYTTSENGVRPTVSFNHFLEAGPFTYFSVEEEDYLQFPTAAEFLDPDNDDNPLLEDVIDYHPYDKYWKGFEEGIEPGITKAYQKIMKKYYKKKKK